MTIISKMRRNEFLNFCLSTTRIIFLLFISIGIVETNSTILSKTGLDEQNDSILMQIDLMIFNTTLVDVINKRILINRNIGISKGKINIIENSSPEKRFLYRIKEEVDGSNYIALPGFINTHTHLWQHISKSGLPNAKLQEWLGIYKPIYYLTKNELFDVVLAASCEALLSGITTVSDYASLAFHDFAFETNAESISKAGLNGVLVWHNPSIFLHDEIKLKELEKLKLRYKDKFDIWLGFGQLSFHSLPMIYSGIVIAKQLNMSTTEHLMENVQEQIDFYNRIDNYRKQATHLNLTDAEVLKNLTNLSVPSNADSFQQLIRNAKQILKIDSFLRNLTLNNTLKHIEQHLLHLFSNDRQISPLILLEYFQILKNHLAIHSVWLQDQDIDIIIRNNMSISHNVESNMYLTSGIAPIYKYFQRNILITIGTDGAASNGAINFFSAMRQTWNVYKLNLMNTDLLRNFGAWDILQAATINGAKALKMENRIGSIDIGKQADLSLIARNEFGLSPLRLNNLIDLLVYSVDTRNVKYVISNGIVRVENGYLKYQNQSELAKKLSKIANEVDLRIINGKIWSEIYEITQENFSIDSYWYKYQTVQKNDTIDITIKSSVNVTMCILVSGTLFGGGTTIVASPIVKQRFPDVQRPQAFSKPVFLKPGISLRIVKVKEQHEYRLHVNNTIIFAKNSTTSGQLLLLALNNTDSTLSSSICLDTT